ncbi:antiviral reverse transcriptase Drt2 [Leptolyngbya sp. NIES-2104]|uniref:antiviral reverse transcriptase Drt2 n=1 Tax=Leptolyngbya sp. NIES-2104 TaxID=1552121 RepID=UPI0006EC69ED|nr:antiviral reverse transcriptase Drt2 [Leptolyngbya sp. NIES-2104]GAQ00149.1 retron-type RNA-directed DNA polymerase [Leptolyngbya sp. NIES-2104]
MSKFRDAESNDWYRSRGYIHFDREVSRKFAQAYITDCKRVERHAFFPFLKYVKVTPRYKSKIRKTQDKNRPILYAGHLDSHIYAWYARELSKLYEIYIQAQPLQDCVIAYRSLGKSNIDFSREVFDQIEKKQECTALTFDLSSFFDNIDHEKLKAAWCEVLGTEKLPDDHYKVYKSITKYAYVDRQEAIDALEITNYKEIRDNRRLCTPQEFRDCIRSKICVNSNSYGIPQGSPISAVLSNLFLINFDKVMSQHAFRVNGIYRRYCDDILWVCPSEESEEIKALVEQEIKKSGDALSPNSEKTEISNFSRTTEGLLLGSPPLQYLGFTFDGQNRLLRSQTVARYYQRMKRAVRSAGYAANQAGDDKIHCKKLYEKYSHLGQRSFIKYAFRSSKTMNSPKIRRQVRNHWIKLHQAIEKVEAELRED